MTTSKKTKFKPISIRPMKSSDHAQALDLWRRSKGVGFRSDETRSVLAYYLKRNPGFSFVAFSEKKLVGTILGGHDGRRGSIAHLAVDPAFRRRGLGRCLVALCLQKLQKNGIPRTHILVIGSNRIGRRFWKQMGWIERKDLALFSSPFRKARRS